MENLNHLPSQLDNFNLLSREAYSRIKKVRKIVEKEREKRKPFVAKKKRRSLLISPVFVILSLILAYVGIQVFSDYLSILFILSAVLVQLLYWTGQLLHLRSFDSVGRFPSFAFRQAHFFTFAFTESLYKFMSANVLAPVESALPESETDVTKE
jgi:hypothetical protein